MAKEYVFQHYVPRTYLEAWENSSGKLRLFVKWCGSRNLGSIIFSVGVEMIIPRFQGML